MATRQSLTNASAARATSATPAKPTTTILGIVSANKEVYFAGDAAAPTAKFDFAKCRARINGTLVDLLPGRKTREGAQRFIAVDETTGAIVCAFYRNAQDLGETPVTDTDRLIVAGRSVVVDTDDL